MNTNGKAKNSINANMFIFCCLLSQSSLIKTSDISTLSIWQDLTDDQTFQTLDNSTLEDESINQSPNLMLSNPSTTTPENQIPKKLSIEPLDTATLNQNVASLEKRIKYLQKNISYLQKSKKLRDPNIMEKIRQNQKIIQIYKNQITAYQKQITALKSTTPSTNSNRSLNLGRLSCKKRKS